jgi:dTDP-4-dehydrorhamnose reductase
MQKALIIGSTGLLGSRLSKLLSNQYELTCTHHKNSPLPGFNSINVAITSLSELEKLFSDNYFDVVINCAGLTNVEACETWPEAAWQLNATLPYRLAILSKKYNSRLIHISTDHFFSEHGTPRSEIEFMVPVNQYGYSKLAGEKYVLKFNDSATVIRTNFFGLSTQGSHSLLDFLVSKLSSNQTIIGFEDVHFSPLGVSTLALLISEITKREMPGLINVAGGETVSKYEFACLVATALGSAKTLVHPGSVSSLGGSVARPSYLALDSTKLVTTFKFHLPQIKSMIEAELKNAI